MTRRQAIILVLTFIAFSFARVKARLCTKPKVQASATVVGIGAVYSVGETVYLKDFKLGREFETDTRPWTIVSATRDTILMEG